jgi:2-polyprenyl-6-methoxyphenol hydroxylase-like FAD-dependent oxidoreductase
VRERKAAAAQMAGVTDGLHLLYAHQNPFIQGLRHAGLKAVNNLSFVKQWLTQQV